MRKLAVLIIALLLPSLLVATELEWSLSVAAEAAYKADGLQDYTSSSFQTGIVLEPFSMEIDGRHNVSLPFSVYYSTIGNEINYERKQDEVIFSLEARYSYRFTELFSLGAGAGIKGQWHLGTRYLSASAGGSIVPAFTVLDWLSFSVPVSVYGSRNDWNMTVGIGCVFHIMEAFR